MQNTSNEDQSFQSTLQLPLRKRAPDRVALKTLLEEWAHGDKQEQTETFEFLRRCLDEDRPAGHKLFA
jgi:hypothetical protein